MDISWIGQSLSNISGQISSLTREVVEDVVEGRNSQLDNGDNASFSAQESQFLIDELQTTLTTKDTQILELQSRIRELELSAQPKDKEKTHQRTSSGKYEFQSIDFANPVLEVSSSPFLTEEVIKNPFADDVLRKDEAVPEKKIARRDQQTQTRDVCSDASSLRRSTSLGGDLDTSRPTPDVSCNQEIFKFLSHLETEVSKLRAQSDCNLSSEDVDRKFLKTLKNNITEWKEKSMTIGPDAGSKREPNVATEKIKDFEKPAPSIVTTCQVTQCELLPEKVSRADQSVQVTVPEEKKPVLLTQSTQVDPVQEPRKAPLSNQSTQSELPIVSSSSTQSKQVALRTVACDNLADDAKYLTFIGLVKSPEEEAAEAQLKANLSTQNEGLVAQTAALLKENSILLEKVKSVDIKNELMQEELKRLRQHMMEVEEEYTQEALIKGRDLQDLQARYSTMEAKHLETISTQNQRRDLSERQLEQFRQTYQTALAQRDEAIAKLGEMEDEFQRQMVSSQNLQSVIEQLQLDRDKVLDCKTYQLEEEVKRCSTSIQTLEKEKSVLQEQLADAKSSLKAAARLTNQLDLKSEQIDSLQIEVAQLKQQLREAKENAAESLKNSAGVIDKNLAKNLIVSFLMAPPNNKMDALKIVATFLDFSEDDRVKLGMQKGQKKAGPQESLTEAFVRFLEKESKVVAPSPIHRVVKEQFKESQAMSTEMTPVANSSSSSMLKDVLKPAEQ